MHRIVCALIAIATLAWPASSLADYYLKFTATGGSSTTHDLSQDPLAVLSLSIVDTHPTSELIHEKGSGIVALTKVNSAALAYGTGQQGVDNLNFYVADVPRSLTIKNRLTGQKSVISVDDPNPTPFVGAPAFLMSDGMVVAPGLSQAGSPRKFYVASGMPAHQFSAFWGNGTDLGAASDLGWSGTEARCTSGWQQSMWRGDQIVIMQAMAGAGSTPCRSVTVYAGKLSHVVLEE